MGLGVFGGERVVFFSGEVSSAKIDESGVIRYGWGRISGVVIGTGY